jgi:two-component system, LytTR family, sensor kinase
VNTVAGTVIAVLVTAVVGAGAVGLWRLIRRRDLGTSADRATYETLHLASLASPGLRDGLTSAGAYKAAKHLRAMLGCEAIAITDGEQLLAWDGSGEAAYAPYALQHAAATLRSGRTEVEPVRGDPKVPIRDVIVTPLVTADAVIGTLSAYVTGRSYPLVNAVDYMGRWVSGQLDLAELDASRTRVAEAQVRALRAQISPHFIYNSLTAIANFVRTDPERARELLLEFADFTRYSFRRSGDYTTLQAELESIYRYLKIERARFGDRLQVTLRVAPEVLPVAIPFLCIQPLVENAVRHGLEGKPGLGHVTILAEDAGSECMISVDDDGVGMAPERVRAALRGEPGSDSVGLGNVDERLRMVFGDAYGLTVATAPGAGMKVSMRVPKFHPNVRA